MDFTSLTPGCYEVDGYIIYNANNVDYHSHYPHYFHSYDTIKIDEDYTIYSQEYPNIYGHIEEGYEDDNNIYLQFVDPLHQRIFYEAKPSNDNTLLFSGKDKDGNLLCLKIKKSEC